MRGSWEPKLGRAVTQELLRVGRIFFAWRHISYIGTCRMNLNQFWEYGPEAPGWVGMTVYTTHINTCYVLLLLLLYTTHINTCYVLLLYTTHQYTLCIVAIVAVNYSHQHMLCIFTIAAVHYTRQYPLCIVTIVDCTHIEGLATAYFVDLVTFHRRIPLQIFWWRVRWPP